jgi:hypothetical protein
LGDRRGPVLTGLRGSLAGSGEPGSGGRRGLRVLAGRWSVKRMERSHAPSQPQRTDCPRPSVVAPAGSGEAVSGYGQSCLGCGRRSPSAHPHSPCIRCDGGRSDPSESISPCVDVHSITRPVHFRHPCELVIHHVNPYPYGHTGCAGWRQLRSVVISIPAIRCAAGLLPCGSAVSPNARESGLDHAIDPCVFTRSSNRPERNTDRPRVNWPAM